MAVIKQKYRVRTPDVDTPYGEPGSFLETDSFEEACRIKGLDPKKAFKKRTRKPIVRAFPSSVYLNGKPITTKQYVDRWLAANHLCPNPGD